MRKRAVAALVLIASFAPLAPLALSPPGRRLAALPRPLRGRYRPAGRPRLL